jgi:hypothetical protein
VTFIVLIVDVLRDIILAWLYWIAARFLPGLFIVFRQAAKGKIEAAFHQEAPAFPSKIILHSIKGE